MKITIILGCIDIILVLVAANGIRYVNGGRTWHHLRRAVGALALVALFVAAYSIDANLLEH